MYDADAVEPVKRLLHSVLDAVVAVYASNSVELPDRQYVQLGPATLDCEQVTVSLVQLYLGGPGDQAILPQQCDGIRTAVMAVEVVRCIPAVKNRGVAPTPEEIQTAADTLLVDSWLLMEALPIVVKPPGFGVLADVTVGERSGGFQGIILNLIMPVL